MSYSQAAPPHEVSGPRTDVAGRRSEQAAKRPGTVFALLGSAIGSATTAIVGAVIVYSGGNGLADSNVKEVIKQHPDAVGLPTGMTADDVKQLTGPLWQQVVDDRAGTLSSRAGFALFVGACVLLSAFFARRAAVWSRVLVTVFALVGLIPQLLIVTDYEPASVTALTWVALVCGLAAAVLCWLPGVRRYGNDNKAARAGAR